MLRKQTFFGPLLTAALFLGPAASCAAQYAALPRAATPIVSRMDDDQLVAASFRLLVDELIGDSADRICVSVADGDAQSRTADDAVDRDPSEAVLRRLRGARVIVMARSVCAADERNFGPTRGLLRLRGVTLGVDSSLTIDADAIADHFARYQCTAKLVDSRPRQGRCRLISRD